MKDVLKIEGLSKSFDGFSLSDVDLVVAEGGVTGFVGSNGAGKTTTLKLALGLLFPDAGTIELFGRQVNPRVLEPSVKERIGVVFDSCPFPAEMRVSDVGRLGARSMSSWDREKYESLCRRLSIPAAKKIRQLSRGMGMKLQLVFALAHGPQLLMLDEATAGLDPLARDEVLSLLLNYMESDNHGILISTHITSDLEKIADHVACIDGGRLVFTKAVEEICDISGIAHCRDAELRNVTDAGLFAQGSLRVLDRGSCADVLVPDLVEFARMFPDIPCDRATIDEYMVLSLRGERR